jgi:Protein of unknown function (DUF1553)/Protein of unknown function (DUF1549)/Planctomycete cytochrome C
MYWTYRRAFLLIGGVTALLAQAPRPDVTGAEFFEKKIRPVFATRCYVCHSASAPKIQGGLQLDTRDLLRRGGNSGSPIVPGDPNASLLIKALRYTEANLKMPPGKALAPEVVADFEQWVRMGAPDPRTEAPKTTTANRSREWWSLKKPVRPEVPDISDKSWLKTPVDNFILAKLAEAKLKPSAPADKRTLIRRATYDLIGLPPTQTEIDEFAADTSANAFEKVVDRLLASPQYGVRWGRHWMDVSRYADTADGPDRFAFSYTYRDWVIGAFNEDMPFDQFAKKQIAADQLDHGDKRDLAALGFITLGRSVPKGEHDMIDDRIDVITRGLLGMTVTCARCHDHKFDPIPTRDYYSFYGIIANSVEPVEYPVLRQEDASSPLVHQYRQGMERRLEILNEFKTKRHAELVAEFRQASWISRYLLGAQAAFNMDNAEIEALSRDRDFNLYMLRRWRDYLHAAREKQYPVFAMWNMFAVIPKDQFAAQAAQALQRVPANANPELKKAFAANPPATMDDVAKTYGEVLARFDSPETNPNTGAEALRLDLRGDQTPTNVPLEDFVEIRGNGGDDNILRGLEGAIREWEAEFSYRGVTPRAMAIQEPAKLVPAHVFVRGNPNNPGAETPPHFLSALDGAQRPFTHGSGRLDLANAIADRNNPLTARVIVNRVWQWHFGRGIVNSPSDFGTRGDLPTHPELLDYLAIRFMDEGWSIKKLHKWIMLSSTYQQSSVDRPDARAADPENKLVWRMNRQRLDFESLRDSILFVSGQLDLTLGGLPFSMTAQPAVPRRTVYAYIQRGHLPGELSAFDFATPESHVPQRFLTTVPQQALYLMNSPFILEESKHLVARGEIRSAPNNRARVDSLYQDIYGRAATSDEFQAALDYIKSEDQKQQPAPAAVWQYGLASIDDSGRIERFDPLKYFVEQKWQPASITPQSAFGDAELSAKGGMPPDDPKQAIVRRWVSPVSGTVEIAGTLTHEVTQKPEEYHKEWGDGVRARIVVNSSSKVAEEIVYNRKAELAVQELAVVPGDTIDFVVDSITDSENDGFQWAPVITLKAPRQEVWDARKDFGGPAPISLNAWEKLAQVLLQTSEFAFVD